MRRAAAVLICLVLVLTMLAPAGADDQLWQRVCMALEVSPGDVRRPQVEYVNADHPLIRGLWGVYFAPPIHRVILCTTRRSVLAHEYAHAVMSSPAYQEPIAERIEKLVE